MATLERGVASCASKANTTRRRGTINPPPPMPPPAARAHATKTSRNPIMSRTSKGTSSLCLHSPLVPPGVVGFTTLRHAGRETLSATHSISSATSLQS
eukprot:scaffold8572_cov126-Isochrysis_galbana.AAC.2